MNRTDLQFLDQIGGQMSCSLREWVSKYPGDPEALTDALVLEIERLVAAATEDVAEIAKFLEENKRLRDENERMRTALKHAAATALEGK